MEKINEEEYKQYSEYFDSLKRRLETTEEANTALVSAGVLFLVSAIKSVEGDIDAFRKMEVMEISEKMQALMDTIIDYSDEKAITLTEAFMMDIKAVVGTANKIKVD